MEPVLFEKEGPIGWLTLNRPDKRNALSLNVMNNMLNNRITSYNVCYTKLLRHFSQLLQAKSQLKSTCG